MQTSELKDLTSVSRVDAVDGGTVMSVHDWETSLTFDGIDTIEAVMISRLTTARGLRSLYG